MNLPVNGRIVVIDDKIEEATPLIQALSQVESPIHFFYKFNDTELPTKPLSSVRIVFLDLDLDTTKTTTESKAAYATSILQKIVDVKNRPFLVIAWTTYPELFAKTEEYLLAVEYKIHILQMSKQSCIESGNYKIEKISQEIKNQLTQTEMLGLFIDWENIIHKSARTTVDEFSNFFPYDDDWNKNVANLFSTLAKARTDREPPDINEKAIIDNALSMFTETFLNKIYDNVRKTKFEDNAVDMIKQGGPITDKNIIAAINTQLLFSDDPPVNPLPGNIYENLNSTSFDMDLFIGECMKEIDEAQASELKSSSKIIFLTVNAMCDYAQKKWRTLRLVPCIIIPEKFGNNIKRNKHDIYPSPLVHFKEVLSYVIFDLGSVLSIKLNDATLPKPIMSLTDETLIDIQSSLASHINRPGSSFVK